MRTYSRVLLAASAAALVLGAAVSATSARRFAISNERYGIIWTSLELTGREPFFGNTLTIRCPVTLEGSLHSRTLSKVSGQLIGYVTSAFVRTANCTGGSARALTEALPWHMRFDSFIGALPSITGIRVQLVGAAFLTRFNVFEVECLFTSTAAKPAFGILNRNTTTSVVATLRPDETSRIPLTQEAPLNSEACPPEAAFQGTAEVFLQSTTTRITVRLVQ